MIDNTVVNSSVVIVTSMLMCCIYNQVVINSSIMCIVYTLFTCYVVSFGCICYIAIVVHSYNLVDIFTLL